MKTIARRLQGLEKPLRPAICAITRNDPAATDWLAKRWRAQASSPARWKAWLRFGRGQWESRASHFARDWSGGRPGLPAE